MAKARAASAAKPRAATPKPTGRASPSPAAEPSASKARGIPVARAASPVLTNKSGLPAIMIAQLLTGGAHDAAYTPTNAYMEGKKVKAVRGFLPPAWVTAWLAVALVVAAASGLYVRGRPATDSAAPVRSFFISEQLWAFARPRLAPFVFAPVKWYAAVDKSFGAFGPQVNANAFLSLGEAAATVRGRARARARVTAAARVTSHRAPLPPSHRRSFSSWPSAWRRLRRPCSG